MKGVAAGEDRSRRPASFRLAVVLPLALALLVSILFREHTAISLEDALITYRHAENLAGGRGLVFNPGERVLGTTTPLFAVLLAVPGFVLGAGSIPVASNVIAALAALGAGIITHRVLRRSGLPETVAIAAPLLFLLHPDVVTSIAGGMETMLVVFLMAVTLDALAAKRYRTAGAASALLVLARIDGLVWTGVAFLVAARSNLRAPVRMAVPFAALLAPWIVVTLLYYGSPIPHTVSAKQAVVYASATGAAPHVLAAHAFWYIQALGVDLSRGLQAGSLIPLAIAAVICLAGSIHVLTRPGRTPLLTLVLYPPLLGLAYLVVRAPHAFFWYLVPPLWCTLTLFAIGLESARAALARAGAERRMGAGAFRTLAAATGLVIAAHLALASARAFERHRLFQENETSLRRAAGEWLAHNTPADASVAMEAIGYQGYYAKRRVIDLAGLVSPKVVAIHRAAGSHSAAFSEVLDQLQPSHLVLRSFEVDENRSWFGGPLFASPEDAARFAAAYEEVHRLCARNPELWGDGARLTIYRRVAPASDP